MISASVFHDVNNVQVSLRRITLRQQRPAGRSASGVILLDAPYSYLWSAPQSVIT